MTDQHDRDQIGERLDVNMVVEAAAGTGKTTELVRRIVAVLAAGLARVDEIVAVTFTEKAAGELKLRLRAELEAARRAASDDVRRNGIESALAHLEDVRIGTIHGFCADLLRERPVEAGVDPGFEVMTEAEAEQLYGEAFARWLEETLESPPEGVRRSLRRESRDREEESPVVRLRQAGWTLAAWRDLRTEWRRDPFDRQQQIDAVFTELQGFATLAKRCTNTRDRLFDATWPARRLVDDVGASEAVRARDYDALEARLVLLAQHRQFVEPIKGTDGNWRSGVTRNEILAAHGRLVTSLRLFKRAADADLAALLQNELFETIDGYERLKGRAGRLDFLDLLLKARDLIYHHDAVRADFQRRVKRIFIDEFQDTDPLQAEILLLLSSRAPSTRDWREVTPAPGKLFIVGDPKQSIYRFRRADVGIYSEVVRLLEARGAVRLHLTTSFRAVPSIQRLVNTAFRPIMDGNEETLQARYVPLAPERTEFETQPSIVALPIPKPYGTWQVTDRAIESSLPGAVAGFVDWLVRKSGWTITERGRDDRVPLTARHVCILFRRFENRYKGDMTRPYVKALEARNIPHLLVGGRSFHAREEVATLRSALTAVEWPDDELAVFATLRGSLFAVGDEELLEYRERFGRLHPFRVPPAGELPDRLASIAEALALLRSLHVRRNRRPVAETIGLLLETTRAYAGFILRPSGEQALANVLHIAELARAYEAAGGISFRGFVSRLEADAESGQASDAPILEEGSDGVRLMTVHKAKGLEFPVVILADITAKLTGAGASRHIDAERGLCAARLAGWSPVELLEHEALEQGREQAEAIRVAYVAATRARDLLVLPAIGDGPYAKGWISPLNAGLYPAAQARSRADEPPGCPPFGKDTVLVRPHEGMVADGVRPGLYRLDGDYGVVWWDPLVLDLDVPPSFGLRHTDLFAKEVDPGLLAEDLAHHRGWQAARADVLTRGARPSLTVLTASEYAEQATRAAVRGEGPAADVSTGRDVQIEAIGPPRDGPRPAGLRFGTLVHAVLATVALDESDTDTTEVARQQGRLVGATDPEIAAAAAVVRATLSHNLMRRARTAGAAGRIRRETPVTYVTDDGTLIEGVVDLAFEDESGWTIVDFKTDHELGGREDQYRRQVALYAAAVARATARPATGIILRL